MDLACAHLQRRRAQGDDRAEPLSDAARVKQKRRQDYGPWQASMSAAV